MEMSSVFKVYRGLGTTFGDGKGAQGTAERLRVRVQSSLKTACSSGSVDKIARGQAMAKEKQTLGKAISMTNSEEAPTLMKVLEENAKGRRPAGLGQPCLGTGKSFSRRCRSCQS